VLRGVAAVGSLSLLAAVVIGPAAGCDVRHVELGSGLATPTTTESRVDAALANGYGCPTWIDAELNARRAGACEGLCGEAVASEYDLHDNVEVLAGTAGRWAFCDARIGPPDAVGIEFVPGCRLFFLRYDDAGTAVRGTESEYQADFDVFDRSSTNGVARIDLHFSPTATTSFDVNAFRCPEAVTLRSDGAVIQLARFDGHGGTGIPVK
jgi:hypothetical protein